MGLRISLILLMLALPAVAQTWFTPSRVTPLELLRDIFRRPASEWKAQLARHEELLTDEFFRNVDKRIRWGIENNHIDDALRFAILGDFALELRERRPRFRDSVFPFLVEPINLNPEVSYQRNSGAAKRAMRLRERLLQEREKLIR